MERKNEVAVTLFSFFFLRQTRCHIGRRHASLVESGYVCSKVAVFETCRGLRMRSSSRTANEGADGGTDVEGLTPVNVGLQDGRWMVRRWMWDSGTDMQRTGKMGYDRRYTCNELH